MVDFSSFSDAQLISPEDISVHLTEGCMIEPEASVSAMVFAHPKAQYFNVLRIKENRSIK
ncbi:hypothetical protein BGM26_15930 [Bacillus sp. FJAT-29790]|uniref:vitamin B12 dependent-methionine synthase activation domain-containing protein n=1 Tax=Bacillus sp. FJAT-29790 TaxID=1895002 RepID=UPI001C215A4B|nr:hypothetical protein [Bacillus sp. FJAT-29790]